MAYSKRHFLRRVKAVNEVYLEHAERGVFHAYIYEHYIRNQFHISRSTFYEYLGIPYKQLLRELDEEEERKKAQNPTLF
jgi:hypothetical protein